MRHEKSANLIELARELAVSHMGLTLDDMANKMGVGRRTAERMRDQLLLMFDTMEEIPDPPTKRWRISGRFDSFLLAPSAKELAALKIAQELLEKQNNDQAHALQQLEIKINSAMGTKASTRLSTDIEALMEAEAIAITPGPKPKYDAYTLNILRDAILSLHQISFFYEGGSKSKLRREVIPYGILFGGEAYLIARETDKSIEERPKVWRIDRIREAKIMDAAGGPPEEFSLRQFAERSFGVFQEDVTYEVALEVLPEYADEAYRWQFHPNQKIKELKSGGLEIIMHGASLKELSWVLFRWGGKIKIISPKELKEEMKKALELGEKMLGKKGKK